MDAARDTASSDEAVGRTLGVYRLVRRIGAGGMGEVWEATHRELGSRVAIKLLHPDLARDETFRRRFVQEGRSAARVRHPNVVRVLDVGSEGDRAFLVLEYLEGETLASHLERLGALGFASVCEVMLPVLGAISAAHRAGVIHRDLKPSNVFLVREAGAMTPKVLDFGISKMRDDDRVVTTLTDSGTTLGTPGYMAPEQLRSVREAGPLSDQFSLGVMLYECATGRRPFVGETQVALFEAITHGRIASVRDTNPSAPEQFDRPIRRALRPLPEERFASVDALAREIVAVAPPALRERWTEVFSSWSTPADSPPHDVDPGEPTGDGPGIAPRPGGKKRWLALAAVGVVLASALGVASIRSSSRGANETHAASSPSRPPVVPIAPHVEAPGPVIAPSAPPAPIGPAPIGTEAIRPTPTTPSVQRVRTSHSRAAVDRAETPGAAAADGGAAHATPLSVGTNSMPF